MKTEFKITEHEAALLERIASATKMDSWFRIDEELHVLDAEGEDENEATIVAMLEDGLGYGLDQPQSGSLSPEEIKDVKEVFRRARAALFDWRHFEALVYVEGSPSQMPTYTIKGMFDEGHRLPYGQAPKGFIAMAIIHHSESPFFPEALSASTWWPTVNFFGSAILAESQLPPEILQAIKGGKCLIVAYDTDDEEPLGGVGPKSNLYPVWQEIC